MFRETMATFKACVQKKRIDGNYMIYIRLTHTRQVVYIKTDLLANEKEIKKGEITNSFINKKCAIWIDEYMQLLLSGKNELKVLKPFFYGELKHFPN